MNRTVHFSFVTALLLVLTASAGLQAQTRVSFDLGATRNLRQHLNGLNVSSFYHFSEAISAGIEMNRYFNAHRFKGEEGITQSAWDFDLNLHYLIPSNGRLKAYPVSGISHTSEKEISVLSQETSVERFWSFNTGAGILFEWHHLSPHAEYLFTWGKINQQFLLLGLSYEIE